MTVSVKLAAATGILIAKLNLQNIKKYEAILFCVIALAPVVHRVHNATQETDVDKTDFMGEEADMHAPSAHNK